MLTPSQCSLCVHYLTARRCAAFLPGEIPDGIIANDIDHRRPYPGDHGVRWAAYPGQTHPMDTPYPPLPPPKGVTGADP
jgi:hypothetical protein